MIIINVILPNFAPIFFSNQYIKIYGISVNISSLANGFQKL